MVWIGRVSFILVAEEEKDVKRIHRLSLIYGGGGIIKAQISENCVCFCIDPAAVRNSDIPSHASNCLLEYLLSKDPLKMFGNGQQPSFN